MNLLGRYLLISMMFVFAAMVEFAFVLVVKQKREWHSIGENDAIGGSKLDEIPKHRLNEASKALIDANQEECKVGNLDETNELGTTQPSFWRRKCTLLKQLPLTTKIDLVGIVLFHVSYILFNVMYGVRVWNLVHENV